MIAPPRIVTLFALAVLAGSSACMPARGSRSSAGQDAPHPWVIPGLSAPVRVVTDRFGIPHVRATNLEDLYVAWGLVTARDRLWQMVYNRRGAQGRLWEWLGNRKLRDDGGAQLFELADRAARIWEREQRDPRVRVPLEKFALGVNAWIAACRAGDAPWPEELTRLGRTPEDWRPEDSILLLLAQGLVLDLSVPEIADGRAIRAHGRPWVEARERFEKQFMYSTIPDSAASRLYGRPAARVAGHPFAPDPPAGSATLRPALWAEAERRLGSWLSPAAREPDQGASNVFAVGARRAAGGRPLLANDPHLGLTTPGAFYVIHVSVPGQVDAIGATVAGLPSIVSGRSRACAWGITSLSADVIDVYADTLSEDGKKVKWKGEWVPLRAAPFSMRYRVLGVAPIPPPGQRRLYTPHGPVLVTDRKHHLALAARWSRDDRDVTLTEMLGVERSRDASEVAARFSSLVTPGLNLVAADTLGTVRYQAVGAMPRRGFDPGYGPLPSDGRHEWLGVIPASEMPGWTAPPEGFVVNANNLPVGESYPEPLPGFDWAHDRAARIAELLASRTRVTAADLAAIQNDIASRGAERFVPRLLRCADSLADRLSPRARAALDSLRGWDFRAQRERVAPTLFRGWYGALQKRSELDNLQGLTAAAMDGRAPEALHEPGSTRPERPAVAAIAALELAIQELTKRLGPDVAQWRWGRAHQALFVHPLAWKDRALEPGLVPADGDNSTPCVGRSQLPWSTAVTHGPVFRHVVDLAVPDSSFGIVVPGNSGVRASGHQRDQTGFWASHAYVPFYLDWDRAETARESVLELVPRAR